MSARAAAVVLVLAGCFKPDPPGGLPCGADMECPEGQRCVANVCGGTVAPPDDAPIDAATGCWAAWLSGAPTFDAPVPIDVAASAQSESNAELSEDQLTLYFERGGDVLASHRDDLASPWQAASKVPEFSTADTESKAVVAGSDSIAIVCLALSGSTDFDMFQLVRPGPGQPFANRSTAPLANVDVTGTNDFDPELTPDGLHLYYAFNGNTLKMAARSSIGDAFGMPVSLGFPTGSADPTISPDERVIIFSATGAGRDLVFATRAAPDQAFGVPIPLSINSPQDDADPEISADGCTLIFSSARGGSIGGRDLFSATVK